MIARLPRRVASVVTAGFVAASLALAPGAAAPVAAKSPGLTLAGGATYEVQPERHRVRITVDLVATNRTKETVTTRYVYDRANLAVLPGTTGFRATNDGVKVGVTVVARSRTSLLLTIRFAKRLGSGRSTPIRLTFYLPDPGGSPARDVRVGDALAMFPVWAYGTRGTPGSSVTVRFPAGYAVQVAAGRLGKPTAAADGTISVESGTLADPFGFSAYVVADRPGGFAETHLTVKLGDRTANLLVRAWTDDPAWGKRVAGLLRKGLPALHDAIGVPYPRSEQVAVEEAVGRSIGGNAGAFDPASATIRIAYAVDSGVVLHEAAHLWFDGRLFADRWIVEGFATSAGERAAAAMKLRGRVEKLTPAIAKAALPLNAWVAPADGDGSPASEAYGYAASAELVRLILARTGADGLRAVLRAAADGEAAYQPIVPTAPASAASTPGPTGPTSPSDASGPSAASEPERTAGVPTDWRGLLDVLAERAGVDATDLWRSWVARPEDLRLLDARTRARADYAALLAQAGDWSLPRSVRDALGAWHFDEAEAGIAELRAALAARDDLSVAAAVAGLVLPSNLRAAFERGDAGAAAAEAGVERAVLDQIVDAGGAAAVSSGFLARIGLLGQDPAAGLAAARAAFTAGDLAAAQVGAIAARETWAGAADLGGFRLRALGAFALVAALGALLLSARVRRRAAGPPVE